MTFVFSNIEVMDVVKSIFDAAKEESFIGGFKIIFLCIYGPYACVCAQSLQSRVRLFSTLWTIARQAPLSLGFSREEYWSELPCPPPGGPPIPGIQPRFPALQADSLLLSHWGSHFMAHISSVQLSSSVVSDSSQFHGPQHARSPCPLPTPRVHPIPHPSSR